MAGTRLVLASNNRGKLAEFSTILGAAGVDMVAQGELGVSEAKEPYDTFVENALTKARHAAQCTGLPALADDSGLCVRALGGAPGVHSARYASLEGGSRSDEANNRKLIAEMAGVEDRRACYIALLVYLRSPTDPRPIVIEGKWDGEVLDQPCGSNGFGYDSLFFLPEQGLTVAELAPELKNLLSHRGRALRALLQALRSELD